MKFSDHDRWLAAPLPSYPAFEGFVSYQLNKISERFQARLRTVLDGYSLIAHQYAILLALRDVDGLNQIQLAAEMGVHKSFIVRLIDGLEEGELAVRTVSESDRREKIVKITAKGRSVSREIQRKNQALEEELLGILSDRKRKDFLQSLIELLGA